MADLETRGPLVGLFHRWLDKVPSIISHLLTRKGLLATKVKISGFPVTEVEREKIGLDASRRTKWRSAKELR